MWPSGGLLLNSALFTWRIRLAAQTGHGCHLRAVQLYQWIGQGGAGRSSGRFRSNLQGHALGGVWGSGWAGSLTRQLSSSSRAQDAVAGAGGLPPPAGLGRPGRLAARFILRTGPAHEGGWALHAAAGHCIAWRNP